MRGYAMRGETPTVTKQLSNQVTAQGEVYDDGRLRIEYDGFYVECGGKPLYDLTRKEFLLLARLARDAGRTVSHEQLWAFVWGGDKTFNHSTFRVHVANLRRKLAPYGVEIAVVVHIGYRLLRAESAAPK